MMAEEGERLYELTDFGLSVKAAKELREQEKAIEEVHRMLEEKKKKTKPALQELFKEGNKKAKKKAPTTNIK